MGVTSIYDWEKVILTDHAIMRGKERLGLGKKALDRMTNKAFQEGLKLDEMYGNLYSYLIEITNQDYKAPLSDIRLYGEHIFLYSLGSDSAFGDTYPVMVTVLQVPVELRKQALIQFRKKKAA